MASSTTTTADFLFKAQELKTQYQSLGGEYVRVRKSIVEKEAQLDMLWKRMTVEAVSMAQYLSGELVPLRDKQNGLWQQLQHIHTDIQAHIQDWAKDLTNRYPGTQQLLVMFALDVISYQSKLLY